ncbi:MAG: flippase-like domain-containing protein [Candidatus Cloacimonetes bacterium]|nr:flippase-like domain-containing protein [Candidatus Cloacimonadota bacterium]
MKKHINWILFSLLGIILLFVWFKVIDWSQLKLYFQKIHIFRSTIFSVFYLLAYFLRSLRWKIILKPIQKIPIFDAFTIFFSGLFINYLIPVRAGELAKSYILKSKYKIAISKSIPSIFLDKLFDLFPIILIILFIPLLALKLSSFLIVTIFVLLLIFLGFVGFLYFSINHKDVSYKWVNNFIKIVPQKYEDKIQNFGYNFIEGLAILNGRFTDVMKILFLTVISVLSESYFIFLIFVEFGASISFAKILFGYTLMNLTYILPTPPAQIGSNQFMWILIFSFTLGINENLTGAAVTFSHILTALIICGIGTISLFTLKIKFRNIIKIKN